MLDALIALDTRLFELINRGLANPLFDLVMPIITEFRYLLIPYVMLLLLLVWKGGSRGRWCVALILVAVALSDPINSRIIKELVERVRPCAALPNVRLLVDCGAGKSFPSTHAVNNFAAAVVIGYFYRRWLSLALTIAAVIGFSRVYVGVHYPFDVLGGAVLGCLIALFVLLLWHWAWQSRRGTATRSEGSAAESRA